MLKPDVIITTALVEDAAEILKLQKLAYLSEAKIYDDYSIPPLVQTLHETEDDLKIYTILKALVNGVIIGSVRGQITEGSCYIGRLMVHPDFQKRGIGTRLMDAIEMEFPKTKRFFLIAGGRSEDNIRLYNKLGFKPYHTEQMNDKVSIVYMEKSKE